MLSMARVVDWVLVCCKLSLLMGGIKLGVRDRRVVDDTSVWLTGQGWYWQCSLRSMRDREVSGLVEIAIPISSAGVFDSQSELGGGIEVKRVHVGIFA